MQWTWETMTLQKEYGMTWGQTQAIRQYWRIFYENPKKYKGTELEKMVLEWLNGEGKKIAEKWDKDICI